MHAVHTRTPNACGGQARQIWQGRANRQSSCDGKDVGGEGGRWRAGGDDAHAVQKGFSAVKWLDFVPLRSKPTAVVITP